MPRPLRTSCDRCHSQKLRCPKEPGVATCTRCLKAGAQCVFSPAGPATRRAAVAATTTAVATTTSTTTTPIYDGDFSFQTSLDNNDGLGMQFDWQRLDFDCTLTPPLEAAQDVQPEPVREPSGEEAASSNSTENRRSACVRQLTTLSVDLDNVYRGLPNTSDFHVSIGQPVKEVLASYIAIFDPQKLLELLFSSGQLLIDLYPVILELLFEIETRANDNCQHIGCDIHLIEGDASRPAGAADILDVFLLNLLILCHTRLLDIFGKILSHATLCAKVSMVYPDGKEPRINLPELRVGNFVASASSASMMQAILLFHIASVLKTRSQQLSRKLSDAIGDKRSDSRSRMLKLQCEVLEENSTATVEQLNEVKAHLNEIGLPI